MTYRQQPATEMVDDSAVEQYLIDNPDFFESRPQLLADMRLTHESGPAISLIEHQVTLLREQNKRNQSQLKSLIQIARDNDRLNDHMQRLTLSLMETGNLNEALVLLNTVLKKDFDAEAIVLHLLKAEDELPLNRTDYAFMDIRFVDHDSPLMQAFAEQLQQCEPLSGRFTSEQRTLMFVDQAEDVISAVLVPLSFRMSYTPERPLLGLLAIGSQDADRYHCDIGTTFLAYLGELISRQICLHAEA